VTRGSRSLGVCTKVDAHLWGSEELFEYAPLSIKRLALFV